MNLQESVSYFHSLLRFGIQPGLERIEKLMQILGNPQDKLQFIHIAGTNGKGSTAIMLSEIFKAAGYRTGLYISPYITDFRERIQINGEMIDEITLCRNTEKVKAAIERFDDVITEFEAVTAAAFLCFEDTQCDIVILETGLGGRFDATNIIKTPLASVITSISLDHTAILGDTLEKIAFEKCGIIKHGCPTVVMQNLPQEAWQVIEKTCRERNSPLYAINADAITTDSPTLTGFEESFDELQFHVPLPGDKQKENAALAVTAARLAKGFSVPDEAIVVGMEHTKNPARLELLHKTPAVLLDGSHNDAATKVLADFLRQQLPQKKIIAVLGMMADKDIDTVLDNLLPRFGEIITTTPSNPRAIHADQLAQMIRAKGTAASAVSLPEDAIKYAISRLKDFDALVVCGSLYLAGDIRNILINIVDELL